jgi:hypothetical protein
VDERKTGGRMRALAAAPVVRDSDGVLEVWIGTALFGVAVIVGLLTRDWLQDRGWGWWLDVAIAGFALGLVGLAYCGRRRRRLEVRGPDRG